MGRVLDKEFWAIARVSALDGNNPSALWYLGLDTIVRSDKAAADGHCERLLAEDSGRLSRHAPPNERQPSSARSARNVSATAPGRARGRSGRGSSRARLARRGIGAAGCGRTRLVVGWWRPALQFIETVTQLDDQHRRFPS